MKRLVVYTCVTGGYDTVRRPSILPEWADWKAFTEADYPDCRYPKLNPHEVFPDYEYSLWIDGNIDIVSPEFWTVVEDMIARGVQYAGIAHPQRDDVFEESLRILKNDRETLCKLVKVAKFLRAEGMPRHFGLNENCIILRAHNAPEVVEFDKLWWQMFSRFSRRDQMTWSYCAWKSGLQTEYLLPKGSNVREHNWVTCSVHGKEYKKNLFKDAVRKIKVSWFKRWLAL